MRRMELSYISSKKVSQKVVCHSVPIVIGMIRNPFTTKPVWIPAYAGMTASLAF